MDAKKIDLIPSELAAIQTHKYFMSLNEGREVSIEEAIQDFVQKYRADWLREKQRRDNEEQIKEIERHKYFRSREKGYDIGSRTASEEWIGNYAHIWREEKESLQAHGFLQVKLDVENEEGLHIKPASKLAEIARDCDCDMYVHRRGMEYYNFVLNGKEYLNVKSVLSLLQLDAIKGEELEFIATGAEAKEALEAVERLLKEQDED
ncbi:MAG: HPr family phosphocarrier protein [Syntrophorhabdales bacterium]|jgi:phosphocarrier protein